MSLKNDAVPQFWINTNYSKALGDTTWAINFYWDGSTSPSSSRIMDKTYSTGVILYRQSTTTNLTGGFVVPSAPTGTVSTTITNATWSTVILRRSGTSVDLILDNATTNITGVNTATSTDVLYLGNVAAQSNAWTGNLCRFGCWDVALTNDECTSFYKGFSPLKIRPQSLDVSAALLRTDGMYWKSGYNPGNGIWVADATKNPRLYGYP